ncbi:MAG: response regulator, partial [Deltaproteobacteria bacterium]|nr:response regulator [Deltaproteobacteria bacterium]
MRVLIAEDHPVTRRLLVAQLTKWGYEVVVCSDGRQAWDALSVDDAPALVVLDWMMPEVTGLSLCRQIRQLGRDPYTYIILLTA